MAAQPERTPLSTDEHGLSFFIQREGESLPANQALRELPINGFEANATTVWIDYLEEEETGRALIRITDDGHGMTEQALREHIKTIHYSGKSLGKNHGLGARVATLARNHAGVTWASITEAGEENMVKVIRDAEGVFRLERWPLEEGGYADVVEADEDLLDPSLPSGTAVILHGNGDTDTWTSPNEIMGYLINRWWRTPGQIKVWQPRSEASGGSYWRNAQGMADWAEAHAASQGRIEIEVEGFGPTAINWFLLREGVDNPMGVRRGRIGAMLQDELFRWSEHFSRMVQFGITSRPVQERFVAVVELPDDWRMNTARSDVERIGGDNDIDWSKIGEEFVSRMPPEIADLLASAVVGRSKSHLLRARFGKRWEQMTKRLPKGTEDTSPDGDEENAVGTVRRLRPRRRGPIVNPGETRAKPLKPTNIKRRSKEKKGEIEGTSEDAAGKGYPEVAWVPTEEYGGTTGRFAMWAEASNLITCDERHFLLTQTVDLYAGEHRNVSRSEIDQRVREEWEIELIARVMHARGVFQDDPNFTQEDMNRMLSEEALMLAVMGGQAIDSRVTNALKRVGR